VKIISSSEEETLRLGEEIGKVLEGKEVICLCGDLGAGKTTLIKGIAKGMGIFEGYQVRSPTFTLLNEYPTKKGKLIHGDLYRVRELNLEEFVGKGVLVVEWAEELSFCTCTIRIDFDKDRRVISLQGCEDIAKKLSYGTAC
jgi:tRNA threonylcarbamoyladenosine biosynthesis protein TsaE